MNQSKGKIYLIILIAMTITIIAIIFINRRYQTVIVEMPKFEHKSSPKSPLDLKKDDQSKNSPLHPIPSTLFLPVPFTPQAPLANWDTLHNEGCEEASAIMAASYFDILNPLLEKEGWLLPDGKSQGGNLPPDFVENQITLLTQWQDDHFGFHLDATSAETAEMMEQVYGLKTRLIDDFTADVLKKELAQNHLVIISEYGRALNNPFYKRPGPIHHMLLVKGYDNDQFITNDSGTKRGLNYFYDFKTLYDAAADWDHQKETIDQNKKIAIVVWDAQRP